MAHLAAQYAENTQSNENKYNPGFPHNQKSRSSIKSDQQNVDYRDYSKQYIFYCSYWTDNILAKVASALVIWDSMTFGIDCASSSQLVSC